MKETMYDIVNLVLGIIAIFAVGFVMLPNMTEQSPEDLSRALQSEYSQQSFSE